LDAVLAHHIASSYAIRGFLQDGLRSVTGIRTVIEYFQVRLEDKIKSVNMSATHAPNRNLVPLLQEFVIDTLPKLKSAGLDTGFIFTH
jgi:hypothetical protein